MKKWLLVPVLFLTFVLSGCFSDPVQEDLLVYLNEDLAEIAHLENEALSAYESVTGANYTDDYILYEMMLLEVIPTYQRFETELESIKVKTDELREAHEIYIEAVNLQSNAFIRIVTALEEYDRAKIEEANQMLSEARKLFRDYNHEIERLADEHNVELTGPVDGEVL
ncbi:hypothetical protein R4Z10_02925 [Niallia sp. XMNu-256]|uniref:hypothetical protein n=1 Tax=Niallia sp. XMNu-256 TaxID=3082444 RepID=UPI0030D277E3